jgi:hypothetical protein
MNLLTRLYLFVLILIGVLQLKAAHANKEEITKSALPQISSVFRFQ